MKVGDRHVICPFKRCNNDLRYAQTYCDGQVSTVVLSAVMANLAGMGIHSSVNYGDTVTKALQTNSQAFARSRSALNSLLSLRDCQQQPLSHSVSEAQAVVQAREDEKKRQQAKKDKAKTSTPTPAHEACPGAEQGAELTKSAYWLLTEVSEAGLHVLLVSEHAFRVHRST